MPAHSSAPARACGIDFGTSNSTVGWIRPGTDILLPLEDEKATLPSAVFFNADEDRMLFGRAALADYLEGYEGRLMRALKSLLGSSLMDGQTEVQGRPLRFRNLLANFIGELKARAEARAGRAFDCAVLGRPVHFVDEDSAADQRAQDTLEAIAHQVGLKDVSFQLEPIGAALHYEHTLAREEQVLIADIGGGTADFSLILLGPQHADRDERQQDVLANAGVHIGGTDFDRVFSLACVMPLLGYRGKMKNGADIPNSIYFQLATWHTINQAYTRQTWAGLQDIYRDAAERSALDRLLRLVNNREGHWLALQVEAAKIALSESDSTRLDLDRLEKGFGEELTGAEFTDATVPLVDRVADCVAGLLREAGVRAQDVDTLYFTGGGSGVPQLRARIRELLPAARSVEGDLFGSIGSGLALEAARRYG